MFINTVYEDENKTSALDFTKANKARALQRRTVRPTTRDYIHDVSMNMISNCPVTIQDIRHTEFIWGLNLG